MKSEEFAKVISAGVSRKLFRATRMVNARAEEVRSEVAELKSSVDSLVEAVKAVEEGLSSSESRLKTSVKEAFEEANAKKAFEKNVVKTVVIGSLIVTQSAHWEDNEEEEEGLETTEEDLKKEEELKKEAEKMREYLSDPKNLI